MARTNGPYLPAVCTGRVFRPLDSILLTTSAEDQLKIFILAGVFFHLDARSVKYSEWSIPSNPHFSTAACQNCDWCAGMRNQRYRGKLSSVAL